MKMTFIQVVVMLVAGVAVAAGEGARRDRPLDATLVSSHGKQVSLSAQRGLPTVVFYEDRHSTALNQALKDELFARGQREGLLDAARVVAVANLEGYNWFPARDFALAAVREAEVKAGIPVLVDWSGTLAAPPWSLPPRTSSVLVLTAEGRVAFERSGRLSADDRSDLFAALARLIEAAGRGTTPRVLTDRQN
jgi:hypothetical protein